jgi:hypothetical protein
MPTADRAFDDEEVDPSNDSMSTGNRLLLTEAGMRAAAEWGLSCDGSEVGDGGEEEEGVLVQIGVVVGGLGRVEEE